MTKEEALELIDQHKKKLINPVELLNWTWFRVIILQIPDSDWHRYERAAAEVLSK